MNMSLIRRVSIGAAVLALSFVLAARSAELQPGQFSIQIEGELISLDAHEAPLPELLDALNAALGGKLRFEQVEDKPVTLRFNTVSIDELLSRLNVDSAVTFTRDRTGSTYHLEGGWAVGRNGRVRHLSQQETEEQLEAYTKKLSELLGEDAGFIYRCAYPVTVDIESGLTNWPDDVIWQAVTSTNITLIDDPHPLAAWKHDTMPDDNYDAAFNFSTVADDKNLYLAVQVSDDYAIINESDNDIMLFQDDSVEIYVDGGNEKTARYDPNDAQITIGRASVGASPDEPRISPWETWGDGIPGNQTGTRAVVNDTDYGWEILAEIPLSTFGIKPSDGVAVGFNIHVNDDDDGGVRDHKLMWSIVEQEVGEGSYMNPSAFGTLTFYDHDEGIQIERDPDSK